MKYFTINEKELTINKVFNDLKELRTEYNNLDISDYIDDLDVSHDGLLFISETYLTKMFSQAQDNENTSSLRDLISLKEDLDEKTEQYKQANDEIETVHNEYVQVLESDTKNKEKIVKLEEKNKELESKKSELEVNITKLNADITNIVKENELFIKTVQDILISKFIPELEKEFVNLDKNVLEIEKELNIYKGGN